MVREAVLGVFVIVITTLGFASVEALSEQAAKAPERWDLRMIREAPIWKNLLVNYGYADHVKHWPERKAALEKVVRGYPESRWADDAALILACGKVGFEGDRAGGIADLRRVAKRYPQGQSVVWEWSRDLGCSFDQIWLMGRGGLVFLNADGTVRASKPFGTSGEIHPWDREVLEYFAHLEEYPRYTKDKARLIMGQIYARQRNRPQAIAAWEAIVAKGEQIMAASQADRKAGAAPDGFLVKRLWRPEHVAYLSLMGYYAAEDRLDEAVEAAKTFVRLCSNDGRHWRVINKRVGDFYAKHELWREAEEQYELALAGCKRYQEEIQARKKKEPELGIPLGPEYQWLEKDLVELERLLSLARAQ